VGFIAVYQNGVMLGSADYTATNGTTVVLAVGALVGDLVTTESFYVSSVLNALPVTGGTISGNLVVTGTASLGTPLAVASGGTGLAAIPHTVQVFASGSGTYTLPANCKAIKVTMVGGGGGGSGGGIASMGAGGAGGSTTFGSNTANNGVGGGVPYGGGAAGGSYTLITGSGYGIVGMYSNDGSVTTTGNAVVCGVGSSGGGTPFGPGGAGGMYVTSGRAASSNTGAGGGGGAGGNQAGTLLGGIGGGGGGYLMSLIASPSATYSYAIGAGGTAGAAGTGSNATAGGAGGSGFILVEEYYV
jgi:hypothetical protein